MEEDGRMWDFYIWSLGNDMTLMKLRFLEASSFCLTCKRSIVKLIYICVCVYIT